MPRLLKRYLLTGRASGRIGVTLFELLVVMMVLAILVTLVIGLGRHADTQTKRHQAMADLGRWQEALQGYYLAAGQYPDVCYNGSVSNVLQSACTNAAGVAIATLSGQTSSRLNIVDPWGRPYQYVADNTDSAPPQTYDLYSWGPNSNSPAAAIRLGR